MRIRIVGTGVMGRGVAQWAATAGHTVELADAREESVAEAVGFVTGMLDRAVQKGRMSRAEADAARARLVPLTSPFAAPEDPGSAPGVVIEAVREDLETKAAVFTELEKVLPAATVFATNTSSLSVTEIGARLADPSRLAGLHFFNPVPLMKIAEVVPGAATREDVPGLLTGLVEGCGHRAVTVADTPGFLVNHAGRGLVTEALALLEGSVAAPADLDAVARDVLGLRMGPFELMDLTGLDVTASVIDTVWRGFRHSERLRPSYLTANRVAAGLYGRKSGRGFYPYGPDAPADAAAPSPAPGGGDAARPVTVAGEGPYADAVRALLGPPPGTERTERTETGAGNGADTADTADTVDAGRGPDAEPVLFVPTWGGTVADAVARQGLPAARTVGVDPLSVAAGRRFVLAVTPATSADVVRDAAAVLAARGAPVTVVRDTAGSVAQRLLASIVSVAASIAERHIASPGDIDLAVTAGLGYPYGPLAWGERVGAARLLELQRALLAATGDPRYRPTRWITERAQLGLPLTAPDSPLPGAGGGGTGSTDQENSP
ncbi:3-hydroxyacyl-CoA dehydrogenase [Streptomyces sp. HNM0575]|uniref:3-hydroxyacyl-CoA dehydrogenase NAD-binding domain-containing protein n=1 Tax=Streptomyces sp. HNM0575 TaxID=2716338 RepID=UPI00145CEBEB|nr:3-hydroxyacyl-CoA dehydrogenase NAD-binding domain-containing protein [Streptomyces sp. HNM0575]NLU73075.1 3-hydroxyacyl-CoA dehydrogenase [Streptomyces sp. HNM0575]